MDLLRVLGQAETAMQLDEYIPQAHALLRQRMSDLRHGRVPLDKLVMGQKLSRELKAYKDPSPAARALMQLQAAGKDKLAINDTTPITGGSEGRWYYKLRVLLNGQIYETPLTAPEPVDVDDPCTSKRMMVGNNPVIINR